MPTVTYKGWPNCFRLANDLVELVVTTDVGPRIMRFGFVGGENEFREFEATLGRTGDDHWQAYGGHRLWHAPEDPQRTYVPDNDPVHVEEHEDFVRFVQPVEALTGIRKEMDVHLDPARAVVVVTHRLYNAGRDTLELAPWALSIMERGGKAIIPLPLRGEHTEHLIPTGALTLWAYTDMTDSRWTWGRRYVLLAQDADKPTPQKAGAFIPDGWVAYARNGHLLVKTFDIVADATYPDFGSMVETFTNADMLEIETLGPMARMAPGDHVEHVERWFLFKDVPVPENDADVDAHVIPRIDEARME